MPGSTIVATNVATKVETTRKTNEVGRYVIAPFLPVRGVHTDSLGWPAFKP